MGVLDHATVYFDVALVFCRESLFGYHHFLPPVRRLLDAVYEMVQLHGGIEIGLAGFTGAYAFAKLVVHLPHVVSCAPWHPLQHLGVFARDFQVT